MDQEQETPKTSNGSPFSALFNWIAATQEVTPLPEAVQAAVTWLKLLPIDALVALLATETKQLEEGRVYVASAAYGASLYHIIDKRYDCIQIDQLETDEKWSKSIRLHNDEVQAVLKTLLSWHLEDARKQQEQNFLSEDLGELDDHPF
jgi:hypothetical protein